MKIEWIPGAAMIALVMCGSMFAQDCGCNGHGNAGYVGTGRAPHAWTYDQAVDLWGGYCSEQPACHSGCGLLNGCNTGCASRWPAACSDCNSCGNGCGLNFGSCGGIFGGGCGNKCGGSVLSRFAPNSDCGCNASDDGCSGHRHGLDLFGGLRSRVGCGHHGLFPCAGACGGGCDSGSTSGCGCN